jgi:broad specificity phosphatase PhoE
MAIYLLRHGESEGNIQRINQGRIDMPLTERGRQQAATAGRWLAKLGVEPEVIYASPLRRAWETAEIVASHFAHEYSMHEAADVIEYHEGKLQGMRDDDIYAQYPEYKHRTLDERGCMAKWGGESYEDVQARLQSFIGTVGELVTGRAPVTVTKSDLDADLRRVPGHTGTGEPPQVDVLAVAHGGSLYQLLKLWCGWPAPRHYFTRIANCTCFKLELREISGHLAGELQWMVPVELMELPA